MVTQTDWTNTDGDTLTGETLLVTQTDWTNTDGDTD